MQRALLPAVDAGLRVVATGRRGDLIADDREPRLVWKILQDVRMQFNGSVQTHSRENHSLGVKNM